VLGWRQALGVVLALGTLLGGRQVRHQLLVGPDGAWRREMWLDAVLKQPEGDAGEGVPSGSGAMTVSEPPAGRATDVPENSPAAAGAAAPTGRPSRAAGRSARATLTTPLAINTCRPDSLQLLPGVGPVLAARIDEARRQGTIFRKPTDLLGIKGIGPAAMARLTPLVDFSAPSRPAASAHNPH